MSVDLEALSAALAHSLWQGSLVAIVVGVALGVLPARRASLRHAIALGGLALVVLLAVGTYVGARGDVVAMGSAAAAPGGVPAPLAVTHRVVAALWALGVVICALRVAGGFAHLEGLRRAADDVVDARWHTRLRALAARLGVTRPVRLAVSLRVDAPVVLGWWRPVVLVPLGWLTDTPPDQVEAILAHELAHVRRHDVLVQWLQRAVESLFFFHPAVWWISARLTEERECCADAVAVGCTSHPVGYARALASLEARRPRTPRVPVATFAHGGSLMNRIRRLLEPETRRGLPAVPLLAFTALAALAPLAPSGAHDEPVAAPTPHPQVSVSAPHDTLHLNTALDCSACHVASTTDDLLRAPPAPRFPAPTATSPGDDEVLDLELTPDEWALLHRIFARYAQRAEAPRPTQPRPTAPQATPPRPTHPQPVHPGAASPGTTSPGDLWPGAVSPGGGLDTTGPGARPGAAPTPTSPSSPGTPGVAPTAPHDPALPFPGSAPTAPPAPVVTDCAACHKTTTLAPSPHRGR